MLTGPDGQPAKPTQETAEPDMSKPILQIDTKGNLTLFVPLALTNDVYARGLVDVTRSHIIQWYAQEQAKRREMGILAAKTGYQRFKDKVMGR